MSCSKDIGSNFGKITEVEVERITLLESPVWRVFDPK